jgi:hypothetical protein
VQFQEIFGDLGETAQAVAEEVLVRNGCETEGRRQILRQGLIALNRLEECQPHLSERWLNGQRQKV